MVSIDFSPILAVVVGLAFFALSQLGIGFFREVGANTANIFSSDSSNTPSVYVEGRDFEMEVDDNGTVNISSSRTAGTTSATSQESEEVQELEKSTKIIVEGVFDRMILKSVLDYFCEYSSGVGHPCDASIVVAQGSANIPHLLKWAQNTGEDYFAIVDHDVDPQHRYDEVQSRFDTDYILVVGEASGKESAVMLIDLFDSSFIEDCLHRVSDSPPTLDEKVASEVIGPTLMREVVDEIVARLDKRRDVNVKDVRDFRPILWTIYEQSSS